jgi:hypothetical protein
MKSIHEGLEPREFIEPAEGITRVTVSTRSGLLPTEDFNGETYEEIFVSGTEPREFDNLEDFEERQRPVLVNRLREGIEDSSYSLNTSSPGSERATSTRPTLDLNLELDLDVASRGSDSRSDSSDTQETDEEEGNPLLD